MSRPIGFALLVLLQVSSALAQSTDSIRIPYVEGKLLEWGAGYDLRTFEAHSSPCVAFVKPPDQWTSHSGQAALRTVESARDLESELDVKISDSVKGGLFKESFSAQVVNKLNLSSSSLTVVARSKLIGEDELLQNVTLTPEARKLLESDDKTLFRKKCGDYYVHGFVRGGRYNGTVNISTRNLEDRASLKANFSAEAGAIVKVEQSVDIAAKLRIATSGRTAEFSETLTGGVGMTNAPNVEGLIANYSRFPEEVLKHPARIEVILVPYDDIKDVDVARPNPGPSESVLTDIAYTRIELQRLRENARFAQSEGVRRQLIRPDNWSNTVISRSTELIKRLESLGTQCGDPGKADDCRAQQNATWSEMDHLVDAYFRPAPRYWQLISGDTKVKQISAGGSDQVWGVDAAGDAVKLENGQWVRRGDSTPLRQISVGADGQVYAVRSGSNHWVRLDPDGKWYEDRCCLNQIEVATNRVVWGLGTDGRVYRFNGNSFEAFSRGISDVKAIALLKDVSRLQFLLAVAGPERAVYAMEVRTGNREPESWKRMEQASSRGMAEMSFRTPNDLWGIDANGALVHGDLWGWEVLGSGKSHVAAAPDGNVYTIDGQGNTYVSKDLVVF